MKNILPAPIFTCNIIEGPEVGTDGPLWAGLCGPALSPLLWSIHWLSLHGGQADDLHPMEKSTQL